MAFHHPPLNVLMNDLNAPTYADVVDAAQRIAGVAYRTPIMTSKTVDARVGASLFFKCENFQRTGAFKFRGALNAISHFSSKQRRAGVLTYSSGNHAQAIALSARIAGIKATVLMPEDAPAAKIIATRSYGGEVITYSRYTENGKALAAVLAEERGMTLIPPYDHPHVIAGQGTAARELIEETGALDYLFVCLGGGGLIGGCALAAAALSPSCKVIGVEPEAGNDAQQSLARGEIVHIDVPRTFADGAASTHIGCYNFPILQRHVDRVVSVSDEHLIEAMRFFAQCMKIVVEPTGCLAAAAVLRNVVPIEGKRAGVLVSGGNVDLARFANFLA
jgi:threo-3-hydroxy-L-aspartate ammonia-lyase